MAHRPPPAADGWTVRRYRVARAREGSMGRRRAGLAAAVLLSGAGAAAAADCDLLLAGGRVIDGTGAPWFRADVCVTGDRITAVSAPGTLSGRRRIDLADAFVTPGFIDMLGQSEYNVLVDPRAASKITQGITTEITGEGGGSVAPMSPRMVKEGQDTWTHYGVQPDWTDFAGYFRAFERARPAINLGSFVGAGAVRDYVIGRADRGANPA